MRKKLKRVGECVSCGECCKKLRITTVLSHLISQHGSFEEAKAYYSFRGMELTGQNSEMDIALLTVDIPCDKLTDDNKCLLHENPEKKPYICHRYPWYQDSIESCGFSFEEE